MSLSQQAVGGVLWASVEKFGGKIIQFVTTIILARLLLPDDFGIFALVIIVFAIANVLIDSGFSQALIRQDKISEKDKSTTFYLNVLISLIIFVIIWAIAPMVSDFYEETILINLMRFMAFTPVFLSFTIIHRAYFIHKINFRTQAYINLLASILSGLLAIYSALKGLGVWALAVQFVSISLISSLLYWIANPWKPIGFINSNSFKRLFGFGSNLMLSGLINITFVHLYKVIIGKIYEIGLLGFYAQAENIKTAVSENLISVMARVNYTALSKVKEDQERLKDAYIKTLKVSSFFIFPSMIGLILIAEPLVMYLLGSKWAFTVPILQLLSVSGLIHHLQVINLDILKVLGRSDLFLKLEIIKKVGVTIAIIVGLRFGFWGLLLAQVISAYLSLFINMTYTSSLMNYLRVQQFKDIAVVFSLSIPMAIAVYGIHLIDISSYPLELIASILTGISVYFGLSYIIKPSPFKDIIYLLRPRFSFLKKIKL